MNANSPIFDPELDVKACTIALTYNELMALKAHLLMGKMFTHEEYKKRVKNVFGRISKILIKSGHAADTAARLTEL